MRSQPLSGAFRQPAAETSSGRRGLKRANTIEIVALGPTDSPTGIHPPGTVPVEEYVPNFLPSSRTANKSSSNSNAHAVYVSLVVGGLAVGAAKAAAYCVAPSATVRASLFDSMSDIVGYLIMLVTEHLMRQADEELFPAGQGRFEPLGVLSFAVFSATTFFNLIIHAAERISGGGSEPEEMSQSTFLGVVSVMCGCITAKLFCAGFCKRAARQTGSEVAKTLSIDHVLDTLSNCFVLCVFCSLHFWHGQLGMLERYFDDLCCIALSSNVLLNWALVVRAELKIIAGHAADPELKNKIAQNAATIVEEFPGIDARLGTLRLFHIGKNLMAEVELQVSCGGVVALAKLVRELEDKLTDKEVERVLVTVRAGPTVASRSSSDTMWRAGS